MTIIASQSADTPCLVDVIAKMLETGTDHGASRLECHMVPADSVTERRWIRFASAYGDTQITPLMVRGLRVPSSSWTDDAGTAAEMLDALEPVFAHIEHMTGTRLDPLGIDTPSIDNKRCIQIDEIDPESGKLTSRLLWQPPAGINMNDLAKLTPPESTPPAFEEMPVECRLIIALDRLDTECLGNAGAGDLVLLHALAGPVTARIESAIVREDIWCTLLPGGMEQLNMPVPVTAQSRMADTCLKIGPCVILAGGLNAVIAGRKTAITLSREPLPARLQVNGIDAVHGQITQFADTPALAVTWSQSSSKS